MKEFWHSIQKDDYLKPASDLNWFDIKVIFDGKPLGPAVPEPLEEQYTQTTEGDIYSKTEAVRWYGKWAPILLWNTQVLEHNKIERFTLYYDDFVPYMRLILHDPGNLLQTRDVPGYANIVTLIMLPHCDGAYKAIKLTFYIENISYRGEYILCDCVFKYSEFEKQHTQQLVFHWPSTGCPTDHVVGVHEWSDEIVDCPLPPNKHPNTYELLHVIAEETGLGFAATDQCSSVRDDKHRMLHKEKYSETIQKHVEFGGTDENNIFDAWIDLYGYITMVNVPWVMTRKIDMHNLAMHAEVGHGMIDAEVSENSMTPLTHRIITNAQAPVESNMIIASYENMVDNNSILQNGSLATYYDMNPLGANGTNSMGTSAIQSIENSVDGQNLSDKYRFDNTIYRGAEMGTTSDNNYPEMHQKCIHNKYFTRLRSKRLKVKMVNANFGLMRGNLVGLIWIEHDWRKKRILQSNTRNLYNPDKDIEEPIDTDEIYDGTLDEQSPYINPGVSGIYYIDGMIFEYEEKYQKFTQYLILIKKDGEKPDMLANVNSHETQTKVRTNE